MDTLYLKIYRGRATEEEISESCGSAFSEPENVTEETIEVTAEVPGMIALAFETARIVADLGLCAEGSTSWFSDPDGSQIIDYGTGMREETSAHLYADETCTIDLSHAPIFGYVCAALGPFPGMRPYGHVHAQIRARDYTPARTRHAAPDYGYRAPIDPDTAIV